MGIVSCWMRGNSFSPINRCVYCGNDKANVAFYLGMAHYTCYNTTLKPKYDNEELNKLAGNTKKQYVKHENI